VSTPRPPARLGAEGKQLWRSICRVYELSPAELALLLQAAKLMDLLARLDQELAESDLTVVGSTGQPRANPLLAASAVQRQTLGAMIQGLALPMPDETTGRRRSPASRANAVARWQREAG
jgi:hypothetical protein